MPKFNIWKKIKFRAKDAESLIKKIEKKRKVCIKFSGGLGNQILSAGAYFFYENLGYQVFADLSYFDHPYRIASPGDGEVSRWKWELDDFGIKKSQFKLNFNAKGSVPILRDGAAKGLISYKALNLESVKVKFNNYGRENYLSGIKYICVHIRRGDYLNVASHLVEDELFDMIAPRFEKLVDHCVIVSDSPVDLNCFKKLSGAYKGRITVLGDKPLTIVHSTMRNADVLICSNSQFSLSAGLLSNGLVVIPKKWYGVEGRRIEDVIETFSDFSYLRNE